MDTFSFGRNVNDITQFFCVTTLLVAIVFLSGCSELKSMYLAVPSGIEWTFYTPPRPPKDLAEEVVVNCARARTSIPFNSSTAEHIFSTYDHSHTYLYSYVDLVSNKKQGDSLFSPRLVTRYQVVGDKISASTGTSEEIFPSVDFEQSVVKNAGMAKSPARVLLYMNGEDSFTLRSEIVNQCLVVVKIFGFAKNGGAGELIAEKYVNFCVVEPKLAP